MEGTIVINLGVGVVMGAICAVVATGKGRSGVGWFFIGFFAGCIGLIIILCLSNVSEEQEQWNRSRREQRRLREQLRQERMKNDAFQNKVQGRLDVHDEVLGLDTRRLERGVSGPPLLGEGDPLAKAGASVVDCEWFVNLDGRPTKPLPLKRVRQLYQTSRIDERTLVWREGMEDWKPIDEIPGLLNQLL